MSSEPVKDLPTIDPAAIEPTTTAAEATSDPVRPTGTDALMAESRPEITGASAPSVTTGLPKEEKVAKDEVKIEAQPVAAGNLGYKAPGLIKSLRFTTKYFWFADEALEEKSLSTYLKTEKPEIGHHNAALATHTGKGLLLFAKREEDKSSPQGILNLNGATDVTKEGAFDFSFKVNGHKHTFQASLGTERDSWLVAVEKAVGKASSTHDAIMSSEGYKNQLGKIGKPIGVTGAAAATTKATVPTTKNDDKVHDGTTEGDSTAAATPETAPKSEKSRSQSRKRASIFGKYLNKKEEAEERIETRKEERAEKREEKKVEKEEKKAEKDETKRLDEPVATSDGSASAIPSDEIALTTNESTTPTNKFKRGSVFGNLPFLSKKEKETPTKKEDLAPAVPAKDTEPVAETAPQLEPVRTTAEPPAVAASESAAEPPTTTTTATTPKTEKPDSKGGLFGFLKQKEAQNEVKKEEKETDKAIETPAAVTESVPTPETSLKDKRRSSFFGTLSGKKDKKPLELMDKKSESAVSDAEATDGEGKKSNKLQGLFRKASKSNKPTTGPVTDSSIPPAVPAKEGEEPTETPSTAPEPAVTTLPSGLETHEDTAAMNAADPTKSATPVTATA